MDYSSAFSFESINKYKKPNIRSVFDKSSGYRILSNYEEDQKEKSELPLLWLSYLVTALGYIMVILTAPLSLIFAMKLISEQERAIQFRLGRYWNVKGPGITLIIPIIDKLSLVDMRVKAFHVPPMLVMLQDGGSISLGATIMYSIQDAVTATLSLQDINHTIRTLAQSVMYQVVSKYSMEKLRRNKSDPNAFIKKELQQEIMQWGLSIHNVELSHITELSAPPTAVQQVQEQLGSVFGQMGGLEGFLSTAADYYLGPSKTSNSSDDHPLDMLTKFKLKVDEILDDSLIQTIGKKFVFHLFLEDSISSEANDSSRFVILNCRDYPVQLTINEFADVTKKEVQNCDVQLKITLADLIKFLNGQISKASLYLQGRVDVDGDSSCLELLSVLQDRISFDDLIN